MLLSSRDPRPRFGRGSIRIDDSRSPPPPPLACIVHVYAALSPVSLFLCDKMSVDGPVTLLASSPPPLQRKKPLYSTRSAYCSVVLNSTTHSSIDMSLFLSMCTTRHPHPRVHTSLAISAATASSPFLSLLPPPPPSFSHTRSGRNLLNFFSRLGNLFSRKVNHFLTACCVWSGLDRPSGKKEQYLPLPPPPLGPLFPSLSITEPPKTVSWWLDAHKK